MLQHQDMLKTLMISLTFRGYMREHLEIEANL